MTSPHGNSYHYSDHVVEGQFAFQAVEGGDYMTCFFSADHKPSTTMTIDFDWKSGVAARDWTNIAKKGSVEVSTQSSLFSLHCTCAFVYRFCKLYDFCLSLVF